MIGRIFLNLAAVAITQLNIYIFPFRLRVRVIGHIIILLYSFSLTKVRTICTKIKCVYSNAMDMEPNIFSLRRNQVVSIWNMLVKHATILLLCNSYCYIVVNLFGTKHSNEHVYGCFFLKRCFWLYWRTHTHTHTIRIYFCCGCICWQLFPLFLFILLFIGCVFDRQLICERNMFFWKIDKTHRTTCKHRHLSSSSHNNGTTQLANKLNKFEEKVSRELGFVFTFRYRLLPPVKVCNRINRSEWSGQTKTISGSNRVTGENREINNKTEVHFGIQITNNRGWKANKHMNLV